jgi:thiol-disulfide isomerase/thioredoxin
MTSRTLCLLALGLALPMQGLHVALKRQIKPEEIAKMASLATAPTQWQGKVAPDFELPELGGGAFRLSDHVGQEVVVLNFFATWCGPCREEMPELARFHERNGSRKVTLLLIDAEEKRELVVSFLEHEKLALRVALDEPGKVVQAYGAGSLPTTVVIGVDGRVALYETGAIRNADVTLEPLVSANLAFLAGGHGVARDAYLAAARSETYSRPPAATAATGLTGRALEIAIKMDCPCGCSDKVVKCTCKTSKGIKQRLASATLADRADGDVIRELNREFCMSGM